MVAFFSELSLTMHTIQINMNAFIHFILMLFKFFTKEKKF